MTQPIDYDEWLGLSRAHKNIFLKAYKERIESTKAEIKKLKADINELEQTIEAMDHLMKRTENE